MLSPAPLLFALLVPAAAGQPSTAPVAGVRLEAKNVFDPAVPGEDGWIFRLANRIHIPTREAVIRRELLFTPGAPYDPLLALETERNLRADSFIRRAEVRPEPRTDGRLDLAVLTQDAWTLKPQLGAGTEGGEHYFMAGLQEDNLLGLGKSVSFHHARIGSDWRQETRYVDPRLLHSRVRLVGLYSRTFWGSDFGAMAERPFFSLETDYAGRLGWVRTVSERELYQDGEAGSKFIENYRTAQSALGWTFRRSGRWTQRASAGTYYENARFDRTDDTAAGTLPADRELSGPLAGYSHVYEDYVKETEIDGMRRVEDYNLGNEFDLRAGPMPEALGSDRDRWLLSALTRQGLRLDGRSFALAQAGLKGRLAGGRSEDWIFYASLNHFRKTERVLPQTLVAHLEFNTTGRLDGERQLLLGGDSGLRGYKNNSFSGTRSLLLNLEDRFFFDKEWFHLIYLGGALFWDAGMVAGEALEKSRLKSDLGLGLRVSPSRSAKGGVLRIDLAYALNEGPGGSRWVVSIRGGQAFSIFNSTNRRVLQDPDSVLGEESAGQRLRRK